MRKLKGIVWSFYRWRQTFGPVVMLGTNGTLTTAGKTNTTTTTAGEEEG